MCVQTLDESSFACITSRVKPYSFQYTSLLHQSLEDPKKKDEAFT